MSEATREASGRRWGPARRRRPQLVAAGGSGQRQAAAPGSQPRLEHAPGSGALRPRAPRPARILPRGDIRSKVNTSGPAVDREEGVWRAGVGTCRVERDQRVHGGAAEQPARAPPAAHPRVWAAGGPPSTQSGGPWGLPAPAGPPRRRRPAEESSGRGLVSGRQARGQRGGGSARCPPSLPLPLRLKPARARLLPSGRPHRLTAACRMKSLGWKELGPSSHSVPSASLETVVTLPPTRSRASVTSTRLASPPCCVTSACEGGSVASREGGQLKGGGGGALRAVARRGRLQQRWMAPFCCLLA